MADKETTGAAYESAANAQDKPPAFQLAMSNKPAQHQQQDTKSSSPSGNAAGYYSLNVAQKGKLILPTALWILLIIAGICFLTLLASSINSMGAIDELVELEQEKLNKLDQLERELDKLESSLNHEQRHHRQQPQNARKRQPLFGEPAALRAPADELKWPFDDLLPKAIPWLSFPSWASLEPSAEVPKLVPPPPPQAPHKHIGHVSGPPAPLSMMMHQHHQQQQQQEAPFGLRAFGRPKSPLASLFDDKLAAEPISGGIIISSSSSDGGPPSVGGMIVTSGDTPDELPPFVSSILGGLELTPFAADNIRDEEPQLINSKKRPRSNSQQPMISAKIGRINININSHSEAEPSVEQQSQQQQQEAQEEFQRNGPSQQRDEDIGSLESSVDDLVAKLIDQRQQQELQGVAVPEISIIGSAAGPHSRVTPPLSPLASLLMPLEAPPMSSSKSGNNNNNSHHHHHHHHHQPSRPELQVPDLFNANNDAEPIIFAIHDADRQASGDEHKHRAEPGRGPMLGQSPYERVPVLDFDLRPPANQPKSPSRDEGPWNMLSEELADSLLQDFMHAQQQLQQAGANKFRVDDDKEQPSIVVIKSLPELAGGEQSLTKPGEASKKASDEAGGTIKFKLNESFGDAINHFLQPRPDSKLVAVEKAVELPAVNDKQQQASTSDLGGQTLVVSQAPIIETEPQAAGGGADATKATTSTPQGIPTTTSQLSGLDDDVREEFASLIGNIFTLPQSGGQSSPQRLDNGASLPSSSSPSGSSSSSGSGESTTPSAKWTVPGDKVETSKQPEATLATGLTQTDATSGVEHPDSTSPTVENLSSPTTASTTSLPQTTRPTTTVAPGTQPSGSTVSPSSQSTLAPTSRASSATVISPTVNPDSATKKPIQTFLEKADDFFERNIMNFRKFF